MSNRTRGRGLVLHFDGSHWILREGRSRQQMSLYPVVILISRILRNEKFLLVGAIKYKGCAVFV